MSARISTFLMLDGKAEEARTSHPSFFEDGRRESLERYGTGEEGTEGSVKRTSFAMNGQRFMCIDSAVTHEFAFTPAMALFVDCHSEAALDRLFEALAEKGQVFMPPDTYPYSGKFAWMADRYGVSWQVNLP